MLTISNLSIQFGGKYLFDHVNITINSSDKIALIGRNGAGKSTLLKLIFGLQNPEEGSIVKPNDYRIGYLPQDADVNSTKSVFDEAETALSEIKFLEREIAETTAEISDRDDYDSPEYHKLLNRMNDASERFNLLGGASAEAEIEKTLVGLGFNRKDFDKPLNEFSGGWRMRVELAKLLLSRPDMILLDEPTNHLDIDSIRWLEKYLKNYPGAVIIVSHDKRFISIITRRTIEISLGKIYDFNLKFDDFIEKRNQLREQQLSEYKNQQKQISEMERFIERFRYKATLASRVQSRVKQLEKIERVEVEDVDDSEIVLNFPPPPRSGTVVCDIKELSKKYGDNHVLDKINLTIERGEKLAFVGKNGMGKSTLSKIIAGMEDFDGEMKLGHNVELGFFAQHEAQKLDDAATVFETIDDAATGEMRTKVRHLLGAFLFSGDDIYKKVKTLSGGERSRLALAKLMLKSWNFIILDEPTNHLDMISKNVLKSALSEYAGSLIIVSHDRDFLEGLTDKTIEFKNRKIREYLGDVNYFLEKTELETLQALEAQKKESAAKKTPGKAKITREKSKEIRRERSRLEKSVAATEAEIESLEAKIADMESLFQKPEFFSDGEEVRAMQDEYADLKAKIDALTESWERDLQALDELKAD